jgi:hypothetical protein
MLFGLSISLNICAIIAGLVVIGKHADKFQNSCITHFFQSRIERIYFMVAISMLLNLGIIICVVWYYYAKWVYNLPLPLEQMLGLCHIGVAILSNLWHYNTLEELKEMDSSCGIALRKE